MIFKDVSESFESRPGSGRGLTGDLKPGRLPMMLVLDAVLRGQPTSHNCSVQTHKNFCFHHTCVCSKRVQLQS